MTYFTVLWVTILSGPLEGSTSGVIYPSLEACEASIQPVTERMTYDFNVICEETTFPSSSPMRPKRNPIYQEN